MGRADYMKLGTHNAICDRCGFKFKADQLKKEWTGFRVCKRCWDPKHPQESLKGRKEDIIPWTRPDSTANTSVTTVDGETLTTDNYYDTVGDTSKALIVGTHNSVQVWDTELTANRSVTLVTLYAREGDRWSIYRTAGGDFDLIIGAPTIKVIRLKSLTIAKFHNGKWEIEYHAPLGL